MWNQFDSLTLFVYFTFLRMLLTAMRRFSKAEETIICSPDQQNSTGEGIGKGNLPPFFSLLLKAATPSTDQLIEMMNNRWSHKKN